MLATATCAYCDKQLARPVGEEEKHIWVRLSFETGIWCSGCNSTKVVKKEVVFCSPVCLENYIHSDAYWRLKIAVKEEAAKAARSIRTTDIDGRRQ